MIEGRMEVHVGSRLSQSAAQGSAGLDRKGLGHAGGRGRDHRRSRGAGRPGHPCHSHSPGRDRRADAGGRGHPVLRRELGRDAQNRQADRAVRLHVDRLCHRRARPFRVGAGQPGDRPCHAVAGRHPVRRQYPFDRPDLSYRRPLPERRSAVVAGRAGAGLGGTVAAGSRRRAGARQFVERHRDPGFRPAGALALPGCVGTVCSAGALQGMEMGDVRRAGLARRLVLYHHRRLAVRRPRAEPLSASGLYDAGRGYLSRRGGDAGHSAPGLPVHRDAQDGPDRRIVRGAFLHLCRRARAALVQLDRP